MQSAWCATQSATFGVLCHWSKVIFNTWLYIRLYIPADRLCIWGARTSQPASQPEGGRGLKSKCYHTPTLKDPTMWCQHASAEVRPKVAHSRGVSVDRALQNHLIIFCFSGGKLSGGTVDAFGHKDWRRGSRFFPASHRPLRTTLWTALTGNRWWLLANFSSTPHAMRWRHVLCNGQGVCSEHEVCFCYLLVNCMQ